MTRIGKKVKRHLVNRTRMTMNEFKDVGMSPLVNIE